MPLRATSILHLFVERRKLCLFDRLRLGDFFEAVEQIAQLWSPKSQIVAAPSA
jgi:hypothetical protein